MRFVPHSSHCCIHYVVLWKELAIRPSCEKSIGNFVFLVSFLSQQLGDDGCTVEEKSSALGFEDIQVIGIVKIGWDLDCVE